MDRRNDAQIAWWWSDASASSKGRPQITPRWIARLLICTCSTRTTCTFLLALRPKKSRDSSLRDLGRILWNEMGHLSFGKCRGIVVLYRSNFIGYCWRLLQMWGNYDIWEDIDISIYRVGCIYPLFCEGGRVNVCINKMHNDHTNAWSERLKNKSWMIGLCSFIFLKQWFNFKYY